MEEYTILLKELITNGDITTDSLLETLNNENDDFISFSDALKREIAIKLNCSYDDAYLCTKKLLNEHSIDFNRNTLKNWFTNNPPKKANESKYNMYKIALALNMNELETISLFNKVYKDRPFNLRNINEFIYYIAIKNQFDYAFVKQLIEEFSSFDFNIVDTHYTIHTQKLFTVVDELTDINKIRVFIKENALMFSTNNVSAKRVKDSLIDDILVKDYEVPFIKRKQTSLLKSVMALEIANQDDEFIEKNASMTSISTMLKVIYGEDFIKLKKTKKLDFKKIAHLPKEILNNFPDKHTFSKENPNSEELRKIIIILASYKFWIMKQYINENYEYNFEDYQIEINDYLTTANLPPLYAGNPFDWLFLFCASNLYSYEEPIDQFRQLISDSIYE